MTLEVIVTIGVAMGFVLTAVAISPVSLKLRDGTNNWTHVNFYEDDFIKFTKCMRTANSLSCSAGLTRDAKHPNEADDLKVHSIDKPEILHIPRTYSNVFSCNTSISKQELICKRLLANSSLCGTHVRIDFFRFLNQSTLLNESSLKCVGIQFNSIKESLLYDPISDGIETCNISCNATTANRPSSKPNHPTLPSRQPDVGGSTESSTWNNSTDDHKHSPPFHHHREADDDEDEDKSHIIIAAVVSMVVTSGLIISGFVFRKHILGMRKRPDAQAEYVSRNPTKEYINNSVNGHQEKGPTTYENPTAPSIHSLSTV